MTETRFLLQQSEENFIIRLSVLQLENLTESDSLYLGPFHSSFISLLFWTIRMSTATICPWFGSVNGDVVQLQGKLIILVEFGANIDKIRKKTCLVPLEAEFFKL